MVEHTRTLGFWVAFALGLGTMIAAGIFSLSGTAVAEVGSSAVVSFVLAALVAGITAASYSEFASIYAENGGGYLFTSRTFDREFLVYAIGVSLFLGYTGTTAFYLATMDEWFFEFIVPSWLGLPHGTVGVVTAGLLGALNARGTEESGTFQIVVTGAKVAVLIAFVGGAFAFQAPAETVGTFTAEFSTDFAGIVSIAALAFITFFGFSAIAASAGEIIEPRKNVPKAIAVSIITVTILYTLVIVSMVNAPIPAEVVAEEGETAMGLVAEAFLGSWGMALIVAGAIFSMVSASNASILAASSIGSLMGRQGQAPRQFARIHPTFGTPFWAVMTATATIVALIVAFIAVFPAEGGSLGLELGLTALTGFATFNLLAPLSVVNVALIQSRRAYPDLERPVRVPLVPFVPIIGILANLALITNLPIVGVVTGTVLIVALLIAYVVWGGAPDVEELFEQVVSPRPAPNAADVADDSAGESAEPANDYRILVPVARPHRAPTYLSLAAQLGQLRGANPIVQIVNVTHIPDQTPSEMVVEEAEGRAERIVDELSTRDVPVDYTVEGHISRDIAFDITQTARDDRADLILMGYPEEHRAVAESVEYDAPCDVIYASGFPDGDESDIDTVVLGAGGGPHHRTSIPVVNAMSERGVDVHLVSVDPAGSGTPEDVESTLAEFSDPDSIRVHAIEAASVADGLVSTASDIGGVLVIGASRDRGLRRWLFGSTPDQVIHLAEDRGVPVLVYASETGVRGRLEDLLFPVYRYLSQLGTERQTIGGETSRR